VDKPCRFLPTGLAAKSAKDSRQARKEREVRKGKKRVFIRYLMVKNNKYQPYFKNLLLFFASFANLAFSA